MVAYIIAGAIGLIGIIMLAAGKANDGSEAYGALALMGIGVILVIIGAIIALVRFFLS